MEYSNYLDEVRSPYKVPSAAAHVHGVARQPAGLAPSAGPGLATPLRAMATQAQSGRHVQLEPPREEDEEGEEEDEGEEDSSSTEW